MEKNPKKPPQKIKTKKKNHIPDKCKHPHRYLRHLLDQQNSLHDKLAYTQPRATKTGQFDSFKIMHE